MGTEKIQSKRMLYCVDPKLLTIKMLSFIHLLNRKFREPFNEYAPTQDFEQMELSGFDNFPIEVGDVWYFETEDDARGFIKQIIGF